MKIITKIINYLNSLKEDKQKYTFNIDKQIKINNEIIIREKQIEQLKKEIQLIAIYGSTYLKGALK